MTQTDTITRGAARLLTELGFAPLAEVPLTNGRRADLVGIGRTGELVVVEVKSGLQDFRSDNKWPEYLAYADRFFFAVDRDFPFEVLDEEASLPARTGIIIADRFGGDIVREAAVHKVNAARRKKLTLSIARLGTSRLAAGLYGQVSSLMRSP
ncbi:MmcB family DNA repair protein [Kordiimonas marina]|uniref:MmcB family DNA repair protein n=1 Tax=Kordiimonas marina TaxID=2872312 RepID=UPI001FF4C8CE|nr:MmcB family DNA repair protein [Kordiimonas marina]MCJ9428231.1 MmcB family DNA repair protein [Kordiimonas marina]